MHITLFSSILSAAAVIAHPHANNAHAVGHRALAQDKASSVKRSPPLSNHRIKRKRSSDGTLKRCQIRPPPESQAANFTTGTPPPESPDSEWKLVRTHEGATFFEGWEFWAYPDPTNGIVDYQTREGAAGLYEINGAGNAIMRVEETDIVQGNRKSIRLHDDFRFNGNTMVILDAIHMPRGCGTWPAFWSNGPEWPNGGEIDILEGVHDSIINQASIHTKSGCRIPGDTSSFATSRLEGGPNCASYESGNSGCGFQETAPNSYGGPFNDVGGGVYAMSWTDAGISVHFFTRGTVPADIESGKPQPDTWHKPSAFWPRDTCDPNEFFRDHHTIFDTTLCGDWAGSPGAWEGSGCRRNTGFEKCEDYVRANGQALKDAYWEVRYVKIYQK